MGKMHKECFYCKNIYHAKCYGFYTKNNQQKFWVCSYCLKSNGGKRSIQSELDKLPLPQANTNFFKRNTPNEQNKPQKNNRRISWCPSGEFANFKLKSASAEREWW